jgi:DUF1680 family protein
MGLGLYAYGKTDGGLYINLYCEGGVMDGGREVKICTAYPFGDTAALTVSGGRFKLYLRSPSAAPIQAVSTGGQSHEINTENGYIAIEHDWQGEEIKIQFDLSPKYIFCAGELQQNAGKAAVTRGPIVYCAEEADNGLLLGSYVLNAGTEISAAAIPDALLPELFPENTALSAPAYRYEHPPGGLYRSEKPALTPGNLRLIPYFLWANRGENEMWVFFPALHVLG